jgi:hypothetical protein
MTLRERVLGARLVQPDQRTCGPSVLVVARMLNDPEYADRVLTAGSFRDEVLGLHRRANVVWPRAFGTTPWAAARQMGHGCGVPGRHYRAHAIGGRRDLAYVAASHAVRAGQLVPLYLGSPWLPRHVVLAVSHDATGLHVYDPASGRVLPLPASAFVAGSLSIAGWSRPLFVVLPRRA